MMLTWHRGWIVAVVWAGIGAVGIEAGMYSQRENDPANPFDAPLAADDPRFVAWASTVVQYSPSPGVVSNNDPGQALGPASSVGTVSLGDLYSIGAPPPVGQVIPFGPDQPYQDDPTDPNDGPLDVTDAYGFIGIDAPGLITVGFDRPITDGAGPEFAVFENGFGSLADNKVFAELARVEVSTNGSDFARFAGLSQVAEAALDTTFGRDFTAVDPTDIFNLAGKHVGGWGTPFDLSQLASDPLVLAGVVDLAEIRFVRVVDIPGNGAFVDAHGHPIFDSWVGVGTGGFDLNAIGVIDHSIPEPVSLVWVGLGVVALGSRRRPNRS